MLTHIDLSVPYQIHTTCAYGLNLVVQLARSWFNYRGLVVPLPGRCVCVLGVYKQICVWFRDKLHCVGVFEVGEVLLSELQQT